MPSISKIKCDLTQELQASSDSAALDAALIISHVTQKTKTQLIIESSATLSEDEITKINALAQERKAGKPMAYLTGTKAFWTMDLIVTEDTLIPRPDTECLIKHILDHFPAKKNIKIADLGTGTGAIAIALATERPNWVIHATDQSEAALLVAKQNAKKYGVSNVTFYQGSWCEALPDKDYDIIVSNPPYIAENDAHLAALMFEPTQALVSGKDGLDDIHQITKQAKKYLNTTGTLIIEHGFDQQAEILSLFKDSVFSATGFTDLSNQPRFIVAKKRIGILLINLGTPDSPDIKSVRRYLKEFLLDPYVIALPAIARYLLVYGAILPFRPKNSAHAYQQIWTDKGSPLLVHSRALQQALAKKLGDAYHVTLGMRYGNPSIQSAATQLNEKKCEHTLVLPLFPQYAKATTQSAIDSYLRCKLDAKHTYKIIPDFYNNPAFINASAHLIAKIQQSTSFDFLLFSYHGLPEYQLKTASKPDYRDQCYLTTDLIAETLSLPKDKYQVAFQSRLGRTKWIEPYTDNVIIELRKKGIKNLVVACPSFVSDCLETLEEIGIRLQEQWKQLGGASFALVPCLNSDELWVANLAKWLGNI